MGKKLTYADAVARAEKKVGRPWFPKNPGIRRAFMGDLEDELGITCENDDDEVPHNAVNIIAKLMREEWTTVEKSPDETVGIGRLSEKQKRGKSLEEKEEISKESVKLLPGQSPKNPYGKEWYIRSVLLAEKMNDYAIRWRRTYLGDDKPLSVEKTISWLKEKCEQLNRFSYTITLEATLQKNSVAPGRKSLQAKLKEAIPLHIGTISKRHLFSEDSSSDLLKIWVDTEEVKIKRITQEVIPVYIKTEEEIIDWVAVGNKPALRSLKKLILFLAERTGWSEYQATHFVLLDVVPQIKPIEASTELPQPDRRHFVKLKIDSLTPPKYVAYKYKQQSIENWKGRRGFDEATLDLVCLSLQKGSWAEKRRKWLKKYPGKKDIPLESLRSMCSRARKELESTVPLSWTKQFERWKETQRP